VSPLLVDTVDTTQTLVIAETFGPTIQGEGPSAGRRASFIRTGGCNLACSWCDSSFTWDGRRYDLRAELTRTPVTAITARALQGAPGLVVITGGEPLLQQEQPGWALLLDTLVTAGVDVEIETNGTIAPSSYTAASVTRFNVSPKLGHAGDPVARRIRPEALAALHATGHAVFKIVCATAADVDEAATLTAAHGIPPSTVWIMPEGTTTPELCDHLAAIADPAIRAGFNLSTRLHVHVWGDERAR